MARPPVVAKQQEMKWGESYFQEEIISAQCILFISLILLSHKFYRKYKVCFSEKRYKSWCWSWSDHPRKGERSSFSWAIWNFLSVIVSTYTLMLQCVEKTTGQTGSKKIQAGVSKSETSLYNHTHIVPFIFWFSEKDGPIQLARVRKRKLSFSSLVARLTFQFACEKKEILAKLRRMWVCEQLKRVRKLFFPICQDWCPDSFVKWNTCADTYAPTNQTWSGEHMVNLGKEKKKRCVVYV